MDLLGPPWVRLNGDDAPGPQPSIQTKPKAYVPVTTLWEGRITLPWRKDPAPQQGEGAQQLALDFVARAVHPHESMPAKLRALPTSPEAPHPVLREVALADSPSAIQTAARE